MFKSIYDCARIGLQAQIDELRQRKITSLPEITPYIGPCRDDGFRTNFRLALLGSDRESWDEICGHAVRIPWVFGRDYYSPGSSDNNLTAWTVGTVACVIMMLGCGVWYAINSYQSYSMKEEKGSGPLRSMEDSKLMIRVAEHDLGSQARADSVHRTQTVKPEMSASDRKPIEPPMPDRASVTSSAYPDLVAEYVANMIEDNGLRLTEAHDREDRGVERSRWTDKKRKAVERHSNHGVDHEEDKEVGDGSNEEEDLHEDARKMKEKDSHLTVESNGEAVGPGVYETESELTGTNEEMVRNLTFSMKLGQEKRTVRIEKHKKEAVWKKIGKMAKREGKRVGSRFE